MKKIEAMELTCNPFRLLSRDWALLSADKDGKCNMMTVSWGGVGVLWGAPVCTVYVRQSRYTKEFIDGSGRFVLTFLADGHRDALQLLGSRSGRDIDKMAESGLTPVDLDGVTGFAEGKLTLVCRKVYAGYMPPENFIDRTPLDRFYADGDYHTMYVGQIEAVYTGGDA